MNDIDATMKEAYNATSAIVMPGSGSYGMEAVARQWATNKKVMVLRNGEAPGRYSSYDHSLFHIYLVRVWDVSAVVLMSPLIPRSRIPRRHALTWAGKICNSTFGA